MRNKILLLLLFVMLNCGWSVENKGASIQPNSLRDDNKLILHMDGANGSTTITDATGLHNLTVAGNTNLSVVGSTGVYGQSICYFDGNGDYIYSNDSTDWDVTGDYTIDFWVNIKTASGAGYTKGIIGNKTLSTDGGWVVGHYQSQFSIYVNSTSYISSGTASVGTWYHVALVWSGTSFKVYVDGTQLYSGTAATTTSNYGLTIGNIANQDSNRWFDGWIDEVRITKGRALWTSNFTRPTAPSSPDRFGSQITISTK